MNSRDAIARVVAAARGGAKYAEALAAGDWANSNTVKERRAICNACSSRVELRLHGMEQPSAWCGQPFVEDHENRTCGCLLYGKTLVGSSVCPQNKW